MVAPLTLTRMPSSAVVLTWYVPSARLSVPVQRARKWSGFDGRGRRTVVPAGVDAGVLTRERVGCGRDGGLGAGGGHVPIFAHRAAGGRADGRRWGGDVERDKLAYVRPAPEGGMLYA